jgi:mRNA interferase MazF
VSYARFDVVLLLFPFTEKRGQKQRPGIVLSDGDFNRAHRHSVVAMVTTASATKWPSDLALRNYTAAGLLSPSFVRAKLFTISDELVIGRVGSLSELDSVAATTWIAGFLQTT